MFKEKMIAVRGVVGAALLGAAALAHAELPTAVTGAFTTVDTDTSAMLDAGWPVLVSVTVGFVLMKIFKKVVGKAT